MKGTILTILAVILISKESFSQCACCAGAGVGSSSGDYNNGVLTLPKKTVIAETYADYRTIKNGNAPELDEKLLRSMLINSVGLRYGLTKNVTISALLPYVTLHTNNGNDQGVGDLILLSTINLYSRNNFDLAMQAGVELPTGIQKSSNFDNTTMVVGSGSFDPMAGISVSKKWDKLTLLANGMYKYTTNGFQGNYYGNLSTQSAILSYQFTGKNSLCTISKTAKKEKRSVGVGILGGYYGEWLDKIKEDGVVDDNSGHYLGFATVGTNLYYKTWALPITASIPVINKVNGQQNEAGGRLRLGLIKSF